MQLQQSNIIVQGLAVVVVVYVGGGHAESLRTGRTVLAREVVVAHADVYRVAWADDAGRKWRYIN